MNAPATALKPTSTHVDPERCPGCTSDDCTGCRAEATRSLLAGASRTADELARAAGIAETALREMAAMAGASDAAFSAAVAGHEAKRRALEEIRRRCASDRAYNSLAAQVWHIADAALTPSKETPDAR